MQTIIIIDDDAAGATLLATLLGLEGYYAFAAENWREPLVELEQKQPDVVLIDVRLWNRSGFDLLGKIRNHPDPEVAQIPVLMMSAEDHQERSKEAGANGFVAKPFDLPALLKAIRSAGEGGVLEK